MPVTRTRHRPSSRHLATAALLAALGGSAWAQDGDATAADPTMGCRADCPMHHGAPATTADAVALSNRQPMHAVKLHPDERIELDGTLSHPAWQRAPVFDQFIQKDPVYGGTPKYATRVQMLYDDAALYVGITSLDDHPEEIRAPIVRHDSVNRTQDFVSIYVDAIGKRQAAQFFRVNAAGSTGDGLHTAADDNEDFSPDFDFDAAAARTKDGWTAVFRIPFSSLRFSSEPDAGWRVMVVRRVPRDQTYLWTSVPIPLDAPAFISALQPLQDLSLPAKPSFLIVRPSVTLRRTTESNVGTASSADAGPASTHQNHLDPSLDVKWHPIPELVVDGTWRPDFSQVALDVPQLSGNSGFALYLPEKRPFFFESADLLRSPSDAFYTRSFAAPQWGLRATWRGQSIAGTAMAIDDNGTNGLTLLPEPYTTNSVDQPRSKALVGRVRGDVSPTLEVGGILSMRHYFDNGSGDNDVAGSDFTWQATPAWKLRGQWLHSQTSAFPDENYTTLVKGDTKDGDLAVLKAIRQTDTNQVDGAIFDSSPQYRDDTGFVNQVGVRELDLHEGHAFRELGPINELWLNLYANQTRDRVNHDVVQEYLTPGFWLSSANNLQWMLQYRGISKVRTMAGGPLLSEHYWRTEFNITPARWMPNLSLQMNYGRMADYTASTVRPGGQVNLEMQTRPMSRLELNPSVWFAWLKQGGEVRYREAASQLLGVYHLDARSNLRVIVQRYTYDHQPEPNLLSSESRESSLVTSLTYAYRKSAGTVLYVGWTNGHTLDCPAATSFSMDGLCGRGLGNPAGNGSLHRNSEAFIKLQADFDEVRRMF